MSPISNLLALSAEKVWCPTEKSGFYQVIKQVLGQALKRFSDILTFLGVILNSLDFLYLLKNKEQEINWYLAEMWTIYEKLANEIQLLALENPVLYISIISGQK